MRTRSEKLVSLEAFCDLETGRWREGAWAREEERRQKERSLRTLRRQMKECHRCPGLNVPGVTDAVVPWGDCTSPILLVGQSAHLDGIRTDVPFIMGSGLFVDAALRIVGLSRCQVMWTNCVLCHPEKNRPSTSSEKRNCLPFLRQAIEVVKPELLVGLGNDAKESIQTIQEAVGEKLAPRTFFCKHPAALMRGASPDEVVNWIVKLAEQMEKVL